MNSSYGIFAEFYDLLTQNIDYKKRAEYFDRVVKKFGGKSGGVLLDLACGTGSLSEEFDKLGYDVIAVDRSEEMLAEAMNKKFEKGNKIQYVCQDMCRLELYGSNDVTICALDSLNHLNGIEDIKQVFSRVFEYTEPNGLFIFDINTEYKHIMILDGSTFVYDMDEVYCVWQNSRKDSRVRIDLDFFVPDESGSYRRYSESFYENAYPLEMIEDSLKNAGFKILGCFHEDSFEPVKKDSQRVVFAALREN